MDFFEAQAHAKKRTSRLVWLFAFSVAGTIAAIYFVTLFGLTVVESNRDRQIRRRLSTYQHQNQEPPRYSHLWRPQVFTGVSFGVLAVVGLASLYKWHEYSSGGAAVAESIGARRLDPRSTDTHERRLLNIVEEMAIASGVPVPGVYVLDDERAINAFAAGLTASDAVVAVTRGTLEKLNRDELQGVVAHEFSHILNGDMRLNLRIAAIIFGILVIGIMGRGVLVSLRHVNLRGKGGAAALVGIGFIGVSLLIIGYVGYFFGLLIQAAVSRQREFLADASAVQFTRNPGGIAGALKKIGGYSLGSALQTEKAAGLRHFFFGQGFKSELGSILDTHPPLAERIRAVDPSFDGKFFEPPEVVDISKESFQTAGFARGPRFTPDEAVHRAFSAPAAVPAPRPVVRLAYQPAAAIAGIGALTDEHFQRAHQLLEAMPAGLRDASRDPALAPIIVYGLLVDRAPEIREKQHSLVEKLDSPAAAAALGRLRPALSLVDSAARLPLLQLCLPALRALDAATLDRFITTLDELVHADGVVTPFEFALQKMLLRSLALGRAPGGAAVQIQSFHAVTNQLSVVLSALAHLSSDNSAAAARAFATGTAPLNLVSDRLQFLERSASDLAHLDAALDKLATASLPIKQRTLIAAAHVIGADGTILIEEAELLRAISAALDCPMPPMAAAA